MKKIINQAPIVRYRASVSEIFFPDFWNQTFSAESQSYQSWSLMRKVNRTRAVDETFCACYVGGRLRPAPTHTLNEPFPISSNWVLEMPQPSKTRCSVPELRIEISNLDSFRMRRQILSGFGVEIVIIENVIKVSRGPVFAALTCFALCVFHRRT